MPRLPTPLHFLLLWFAGMASQEVRKQNDYLRAENRILKSSHGRRRVRMTDDQRRHLADLAKALGRKVLAGIASVATPDTLLRWHRELIAAKWRQQRRRAGRPRKCIEVCKLVVRMATDNCGWGLKRLQGAIDNLGHRIARGTIRRILQENGLPPAPERASTWRQFVTSHRAALAAMDFFTTEVWTWSGLQTVYTLFAIDHQTRAVEILGSTANPNSAFMAQVARNITGVLDGWWCKKAFLLMDRDTKFTAQFRRILGDAGVACVLTPARAPDANAIAERFVRSIKSECLRRLILFGEESLRRVLREYAAHYNGERNHQGIGNVLIAPKVGDLGGRGAVTVRGPTRVHG